MERFPILQFGTSRFLQAHVDLFVSEASARGEAMGPIAVVGTTSSADSRRRVSAFAAGAPYVVQIKGLERGELVDETVEVSSVRAGVDANVDWPEVERLFLEARCVVSNTGDRGYEIDVADRLESATPKSFPAKLAKLLLARFRAGAGPLTFFPCELTPANGRALRDAVLRVLERWGAPQKARNWAIEECVWVNSLVDRIVSQPLEPLGAVAEPYALWVVEAQPGLATPCRHTAIQMTADLKRFERLKLFILNLGHTYLAELWSRDVTPATLTVREAMANGPTRAKLDDLYNDDVLPIFAGVGMADEARAYRDTVIERFSNPFLDHRLADIFANHQAKKQRRFGGFIEFARESGVPADLSRLEAMVAPESMVPRRNAG